MSALEIIRDAEKEVRLAMEKRELSRDEKHHLLMRIALDFQPVPEVDESVIPAEEIVELEVDLEPDVDIRSLNRIVVDIHHMLGTDSVVLERDDDDGTWYGEAGMTTLPARYQHEEPDEDDDLFGDDDDQDDDGEDDE